MLAFQKSTADGEASKCTPHLLPCRIHRDGPVDASPRYWSPEIDKDGQPEAYFRGRKLKGREVKVPEGYKGVVVKADTKPEQEERRTERMVTDCGGEAETAEVELKLLEEVGEFDEITVWGHEATAEGDDEFVKGVSEWVKFTESIHGYDKSPEGSA